ncbi:MAG: PAS domain S-box protein, partial [Desulfobaccales bacterium]
MVEENYRLLVKQIPAVVFKGYADWSVDFFDNKIEVLTGHSKKDFDSRRLKWSEVILTDDLAEIKSKFIEGIKTRTQEYKREYRIRKKDGRIAWVQAMGQIFYDAAGKFEYTSGVFIDITERKQAEEALLKYKFIANSAKDCMTLIGRNYTYEAANAAYCQAHGKTLEEIVGTSVASIWGQQAFDSTIKGRLDQCFAGKSVTYEAWIEFGERGKGCYEVYYSPYFNEAGTVASVAVVSRDITERKKVEEALRKSEEKYRALVNQIPAVVFKGYADWSVDVFDPKIEELTGYTKEDFDSRRVKWRDLIPAEDFDYAQKVFLEALKSSRSYVREHRIRRKDGEIRWVQCRGQIFCDAAGNIEYISGVTFDITERKQMENALEEEATRRRVLFEQSKDGVVVIDQNGKVYESNQKFADMLGYSLEELYQLHVWDWNTQWTREQLLEMFPRVGAEGLRFETVHRRQDGSIYDVEISANWVMLAGRKLGFCVCRNISRRKAAEKALRESEERLRMVNEAANIGTYDADLQTGIARYSPELCAILGVPPVAGWNIQEAIKVVHPEDRAQVEAVIRHAREPQGDGRIYCEHRIIRPDGEVRWLVWIGRTIFGETANGRVPLREIGAGLDITAHKRVEGALRESEEKYRGLIETTNTGYVIVDRKGRVLDANPEYVRLTGYSELVEILGRNVLDWTAEPDRAKNAAALKQCLDTGIVKNLELDYLGRDGRSIPVEINATAIRTSDGAKFLSLVRDISDRKQAEKEKAILEAQLARAQKLESLGTLAGGIAHEFNNILVAIMGYAELAQMDLETSPEPAK